MNASTSVMISEANAAWSFFTLCALIRQALADEDVLLSQFLEPSAILRLGSVLLNRVLWDALAVRPALLSAAVEGDNGCSCAWLCGWNREWQVCCIGGCRGSFGMESGEFWGLS